MPNEIGEVKNVSNAVPTFLWFEFLDPKDGVGFGDAARKSQQGSLQWINALEAAKKKPSKKKKIPIPSKRAGDVSVSSFFENDDFLICKIQSSSMSATIGYPLFPIEYSGKDSSPGNDAVYNSPLVKTENSEIAPNIYIISGHGAHGKVFGEGDEAGTLYLHNLAPLPDTKVIIVPACTNINYFRGFRYKSIIQKSEGVFAILGYEHAYEGGPGGRAVMTSFVKNIRNKMPILRAWKEANESQGVDKYPWSALMGFAPENKQSDFNLLHLTSPREIYKDSDPIFYSSTYPNGSRVRVPEISAYMLESELPEKSQMEYVMSLMQEEKLFKRLEFEKVKCGSNGKIFGIYTTRESFSENEAILLYFYVVRSDWHQQVDMDLVWEIDAEYNKMGASFKYLKFGGRTVLALYPKSLTKSIFLKVNIKNGAYDHLVSASTYQNHLNPSDLVCSCICGKFDASGNLSIEVKNSDEPQNNKSYLFKSNDYEKVSWDRSPYVLDLRIFPTKFGF